MRYYPVKKVLQLYLYQSSQHNSTNDTKHIKIYIIQLREQSVVHSSVLALYTPDSAYS